MQVSQSVLGIFFFLKRGSSYSAAHNVLKLKHVIICAQKCVLSRQHLKKNPNFRNLHVPCQALLYPKRRVAGVCFRPICQLLSPSVCFFCKCNSLQRFTDFPEHLQGIKTHYVDLHITEKYSSINFPEISTFLYLDLLPFSEYSIEYFVSTTPLKRCAEFSKTLQGIWKQCVDVYITQTFRFHYFSAKFGTSEFSLLLLFKTKVQMCIFPGSFNEMIFWEFFPFVDLIQCI